jgi:hypothetical protein
LSEINAAPGGRRRLAKSRSEMARKTTIWQPNHRLSVGPVEFVANPEKNAHAFLTWR